MTPEQALSVVKSAAHEAGWPFLKPVQIQVRRAHLFNRAKRWYVVTNSPFQGKNIWMEIDDATGRILRQHYSPGEEEIRNPVAGGHRRPGEMA